MNTTKLNTIKLHMSGVNIKTAFVTMITTVTQAESSASITVDQLPHLEITVDPKDIESLDLKTGTMVQFAPAEGGEPGHFTLTKTEEKPKSETVPASTGAATSGCALESVYTERFA